MSSITAMTSTRSWAPKPLASHSKIAHADALAIWSPKRNTSTPSMMIALYVIIFLLLPKFSGVHDRIDIYMYIAYLYLGIYICFGYMIPKNYMYTINGGFAWKAIISLYFHVT